MIERNIEIIKLLSDLGANPKKAGAKYGPDAFLAYDHEQLGLFSGIPIHVIEQPISRDNYTELIANARFIEAITNHLNLATEKILETLRFDKFPFVLSGDHSNGAASIAALRAHFPKSRLGVIWIDAHADLHTPYTTPSGNMHGMPMAIALSDDNPLNKKHELIGDGLRNWEQLKNLGVNGKGNIGHSDILFIDIRDLEPEEWSLIHHNQIQYIIPEVRKSEGIDYVIDKAMKFAENFDHVFVSFDIDSLDASLVPGTGTPVADGMSIVEAGKLLHQLYQLNNLAAIEITEINPKLEQTETLKNVYDVIKHMARVAD